jgi:hypothetical protein
MAANINNRQTFNNQPSNSINRNGSIIETITTNIENDRRNNIVNLPFITPPIPPRRQNIRYENDTLTINYYNFANQFLAIVFLDHLQRAK